MANLLKALKNTDWDMLQQQKLELLNLLGNHRNKCSPILDGLIHFLDAIQDAAVDDGIASKEEVFGKSLDIDPSLMIVVPVVDDEDDAAEAPRPVASLKG